MMASLLILLALAGGWRAGWLALQAVRRLPRSNDDLVFY
jgi:hypothetical protein